MSAVQRNGLVYDERTVVMIIATLKECPDDLVVDSMAVIFDVFCRGFGPHSYVRPALKGNPDE